METAALPKGQKAELESFVGRDSSGWKFACVQRRDGVKDGAARQKEKRKSSEKICGCGETGHAKGWRDRGACWDNLLWRPLKGEVRRRRRRRKQVLWFDF